MEKISKDSVARNMHRLSLSTTYGYRQLSQCGRSAVDCQPTEFKISLSTASCSCQQLSTACRNQSTGDRQQLQQRPERVSICRQLTHNCRQLQELSESELFDSDFEEVYESLLLEAADWMVRVIMLKIQNVYIYSRCL